MNNFVLSLLPELGTMGSKRGGVGVTRSSTSYAVWLYYRFNLRRVVTAIGILKISWPNAVSLSLENQSAFGVSNSEPFIPAA